MSQQQTTGASIGEIPSIAAAAAITAAAAATATTASTTPQTTAEWYRFMYSSGSRGPLSSEIISALLAKVASPDPDTVLRENLLILLQESATSLSDESHITEKVFEALRGIVKSMSDSVVVRSQALITQTSLSIELEALMTRAPQLENLVEVLLDLCAGRVISEGGPQSVTVSGDRLMKSTACKCLLELEEAYPGLLCSAFPSLVEWVQSEKSHVLQDLVALAAMVLLHGVSQLVRPPTHGTEEQQQGLATELFGNSSGRDLTGSSGFSIPQRVSGAAAPLNRQSPVPDRGPIDTLQKEVLRAVGNLLNTIGDLSEWGVVRLVNLLTPLATTALVPATVLVPHLQRFVHTSSPLLLFSAADLANTFPDMLPVRDEIVQNLIGLISNPTVGQHWRVLAVAWLALLVDVRSRPPSRKAPALLREVAIALSPSAFDSLDLKEARLCALACCFDNETISPPPGIFDILVCLEEFRAYRPTDKAPRQMFNNSTNPNTVLSDPFRNIRILTQEISAQPEYLPNVLKIIEAVPRPLATQLLERFSALLSAIPPTQLPPYLPIAKKIAGDNSVDPTGAISAVKELVRKTNLCSNGLWHIGNDILSICREALLHHRLTDVFASLGELLRYTADNFADLDIKDRATFYLQLMTHIPSKRISEILTAKAVDPSAFASPPTETPRKAIRTSTVPAFLELKRTELDKIFCGTPGTSSSAPASAEGWTEVDPKRFPLVAKHMSTLREKPLTIQLPCILRYKGQRQHMMSSPVVQSSPTVGVPPVDCIYGVAVRLAQQPQMPLYKPVQQVRVPYLKRGFTSQFPNCFSVVLTIEPIVPLPSRLTPTATFNDDTGATLMSVLDPVDIRFEDVLLPIAEDRTTELFDQLWEFVGQLSASSPEPSFVDVTREIPLRHEEIAKLLAERIEPFAFPAQQQATRVAFLLPPRYHVLISIEPHGPRSCLAQIRTDFWRALAFIDPLLDRIFILTR